MTLLNEADAIHYSGLPVDEIRVGTLKVWKLAALTVSGTPVTTAVEYEGAAPPPYAGFTVTASGGTAPYIYSLASGVFPPGITLNSSTGAVAGTIAPLSEGTYSSIVIRATDSHGATGKLAPFTITVSYTDPYYSAVKLLLDYDSFEGDTSFVDQKFGIAGQPRSGIHHTVSLPPPYGSSSINLVNSTFGDCITYLDDPKWDLGALPFTIDFVVRPVSGVFSTNAWIGQWGSSVLSWIFFQENNNAVAFNVSTTGSDNVRALTSVVGALALNVWSRWRVDYDGTTYRIYKNGVMAAKAIASHTKAASAQPLTIGANAPGNGLNFTGNCRGIRLTVGVARTATDSGYIASDRVFPSLPVVRTTAVFDTATAIGTTLSGANLAVTNTTTGTAESGARVANASGKTIGKYYYETFLTNWATGGSVGIGGIGTTASTFANIQSGANTGVMLQSAGGQIWTVGTVPANIATRATGDLICFAIDLDNRKFWCRVGTGGSWNGSGTDNPATNTGGVTIPAGTMVPFVTFGGASTGPDNRVTTNLGHSPFNGTIPAGFTAGWPLSAAGFATPVNTALPVITGTTQVGSVLVASNGTWTGPAVSYSYQWKRGGTNVGIDAPSYTLVVGDLASTITVDVTATNSAGSATATSAATATITAAVVMKSIDGSAGGSFTNSITGTATLSTTKANDVIILLHFHEGNSPTSTSSISTVTSPNLTWTRRSIYQTFIGTCASNFEIWWAPSAAIRTSEVITITLTGTMDDAAFHVFGVNGCANIVAPWDTNASWTTARSVTAGSGITSLVSPLVTADSPTPMVIGFTGTVQSFTVLTPLGTAKIRADQNNSAGALWAFNASLHQINTLPVSNARYTSTASSAGSWGMVLDALA